MAAAKSAARSRVTLIGIDETGGQTTAVLAVTSEGQTGKLTIPLARRQGQWRIAGVNPFTGY
jgi:hypothetical protein